MYVVTGATGNTGSVVATDLLAKGQPVRAIGRSADRLASLARKGAEAFVADLSDADALTKAFTGAKAAYVMIPPEMRTEDFRAYQDRIVEALGTALERAHVEHVVSLSSIGADKPEKTGPVVGLHHLEQRLNGIAGLNVLNVRAGDFMENELRQIGIIQAFGITAGPQRPDLKLPMIACRDIGAYAADALLRLDFRNETLELQGQRDLDMTEATAIIGKAIGNPNLQYRQLPNDQIRGAMIQMGLSPNVAGLLLEMSDAMNSGYMCALEARSAQNTTPTSFETFVVEQFVPLYERQSAAA